MTSPPRTTRKKAAATSAERVDPRFDWRRIAYNTLVARALDDIEESVNRAKASTPREQLVLYQFSSRGHDMAQCLLATRVDHPHDAVSAYYRSRPTLISLGLSIEDGFASPLGRSGGFSDGRDIGVVCNLPGGERPTVLPMSGDVGSQYTPAAGWAQAINYHRDVLGDASWGGAIAVVMGGEASVATNGFWSALTMATTLKLPMLFYIEDNGLGISVRGDLQTPGADIAENLASFGNLFVRNGDGTDPGASAELVDEVVGHVRGGRGPALLRLTVPRLSSHSGPDNQKGYRTEAEIARDWERDPLPRLRSYLVPDALTEAEWSDLEGEVARDVQAGLAAARARPAPDPRTVARFVYAESPRDGDNVAQGGMPDGMRERLTGTAVPDESGETMRFAEAVRRTLDHELSVNERLMVFGEDVGVKGGVHLVTEGLQRKHGGARVFDTSLSEEGIIGRSVGLAIAGASVLPAELLGSPHAAVVLLQRAHLQPVT
jgi:2-oxoisovalerate dehydrogenase E1 component